MTGKMHLALGTYTGLSGAAIMFSNPINGFCFAGGTIIGSLFPDIDTNTSMLGHFIAPVSKLLNRAFGHRGFLHTPCFLILMILLFVFIIPPVSPPLLYMGYGFVVGFIVHITQDFFTKGGVPLLYPFKRKRYHIGFLKSGSYADGFTTVFLGALWTIAVIRLYVYLHLGV